MAVYSRLSKSEVGAFCQARGMELVGAQGIDAGGANTNVLLQIVDSEHLGATPLILTVGENYPPNGITEADMHWTLHMLQHVKERLPQIRDRHGRSVECDIMTSATATDDLFTIADKPAAFITFMSGKAASAMPMTPKLARQLGRSLAAFHRASEGFDESREFGFDIRNFENWHELKRHPKYTKLQEEAHRIQADWDEKTQNLPKGICYGDCLSSNLLVQQLQGNVTRINMIDAWNAGSDTPYMQDVSFWLCFFSAMQGAEIGSWLVEKEFIAGYDSVRQLSEPEIDALPFMTEAASVYLAAHVGRAGVVIPDGRTRPISNFPPEIMLNSAKRWQNMPDHVMDDLRQHLYAGREVGSNVGRRIR